MNKQILALGLILVFGCSKDNDDTDDVGPPPKETDCSIEVLMDATSMEAWIYYDLETSEIVTPADPLDSEDWDLAFQRFKVMSNGGISGTGGVEVAQVMGTACNDLMMAPSSGYLTDAPDGEDDGDVLDYAMTFGPSSETGPWGYDPINHQLFQSGAVFVVKSVEGNYFKLDFFEYYGPTGDAAELTFRYKSVKEPDQVLPPGVIEVATTVPGYTYLDFQGVVTPDDPANSREWDLAVSGPAWQTNGGFMRAGLGGARLAEGTDFDAITSAPTQGYRVDAEIPYPGPPGSGDYVGNPVVVDWFVYDMVTHDATPRDVVYFIRGADGSYGKLRVIAYEGDSLTYQLKVGALPRQVETVSETIDASAATFTYYSLRLGGPVEVVDSSTSDAWDLGLSRTRLKTNGGTSGPGEGGAAGPIEMPLSAITSVSGTFETDAMIDDPEDPGTQFSGNPVLADWFDGTSTSTAPKDVSFLLRNADGTYSKVKITGWSDGTFSIDHAYAGPDETTF